MACRSAACIVGINLQSCEAVSLLRRLDRTPGVWRKERPSFNLPKDNFLDIIQNKIVNQLQEISKDIYWYPEILKTPLDESTKKIVLRHKASTAVLPTDESGTICDIDTPSDYENTFGVKLNSVIDPCLLKIR